LSHLFPKEAPDTRCAKPVAVQVEQSNKHNEKQDGVGDEADDYVKFATVGVEYDASWQEIGPIGAELWVDEYQ